MRCPRALPVCLWPRLRACRLRHAPTAPGQAGGTRGQVLIIFGVAVVAMVGMLGLATDGGYAYAERRTMQNAADAGAMAGARIVAKSNRVTPLSARSDVTTLVNANKIGATNPTIVECSYVSDADTTVGDCSNTVPSSATGVRVRVQETHDTFFMQAVPGASKSMTVSATAIAHVMILKNPPADGPFLVCGVNTVLVNGGSMNIVTYNSTTNSWDFNWNAAGQSFIVHGPQVATCKAQSNRFKGIADQPSNRSLAVPSWFQYTTGDVAGPVSVTVDGIQGCQAGQVVSNCVAYLPVAVDSPAESNNNKGLFTVAILPFYISANGSNEHDATLDMNYILYGSGQQSQLGWYQGYIGGPIVVRMTS